MNRRTRKPGAISFFSGVFNSGSRNVVRRRCAVQAKRFLKTRQVSNLRGSARRIEDYDILLVLTLDFDNQACRILQRVVDATRVISRAYWAASRLWDVRPVQRHS